MSVIIIGEVKENILLLRRQLNKIGIIDIHHVPTVERMGGHLPYYSKKTINLIILDSMFINKSLKEFYKKIELLNEWMDVPIILFISSDQENMIEQAFDAGIFDFISNPLDFINFKARIHAALKYQKELSLRKLKEERQQIDLSIAKKVQKHALTPSLHMENIQFDGFYARSNILGGDMYSWFKINDNLSAVILYDVMGHGVASALVTMSIRSLLKGLITRLVDPVLVMNELNRHVYELFADEEHINSFLVTAIYVLIDTKNGTIEYANAAHPPGFLFDEFKKTTILPANTPILGLFPTIEVHKKKMPIDGWNRLILYTDGLFTLGENQSIDAKQFQPYLEQENMHALRSFAHDHDLFEEDHSDDITMVSMTIKL